jgi:hypothetical protein
LQTICSDLLYKQGSIEELVRLAKKKKTTKPNKARFLEDLLFYARQII